jgi:plastocyanin
MKGWRFSIVYALTALMACMTSTTAKADGQRSDSDEHQRLSVTVSFGAGLNTGGGMPNQHILPPTIRVSPGGVVNFVVARFHQIFVYNPGKTPDDVMVPPTGTFIDDLDNLFYQGLSPAGDPPMGLSNLQNRVESVSFSDPGTYLVICNVRSHFMNGMLAYVQVGDDPDEHRHQH